MDWGIVWGAIGGIAGVLALAAAIVGITRAEVANKKAARAELTANTARVRAAKASKKAASALAEANELTVRRIPELSQLAYEKLLRVLLELQSISFKQDVTPWIQRLNLRLLLLSELIDKDFPEVGGWFEAERQKYLFEFKNALTAVHQLDAAGVFTSDQYLDATHSFHVWVAAFVNNLRRWRMGELKPGEVARHMKALEKSLRSEHAWRDDETWRATLNTAGYEVSPVSDDSEAH